MLEATFASCVAEPIARVVLVTAPAGVGKSRLRFELLRRLARTREAEPIAMWLGSGDPMRAGSPYELIASAVRRTLGVVEGEPAALRRQKLRARLKRGFADAELTRMVEFLGELTGVPPEGDEERAAPRRAAGSHPHGRSDPPRLGGFPGRRVPPSAPC